MESRDVNEIRTIYGRFNKASKRRLDLTYDYEHSEISAFKRLAQLIKPSHFLDIGANIGVYSVHLSDLPFMEKILAFEPAPETFSILKENASLQNRELLNVYNIALSDQNGTAEFAVYGALAGNNALVVSDLQSKKDHSVISVPTKRLDDEVLTANVQFMCKIDVEGHERSVIRGGQKFFGNNQGILQVEAFAELDKLIDELAELGYRRIFQLKSDYYFTNIPDNATIAAMSDILFDEVARALGALKNEKILRRKAIRASRAAFDSIKFGTDPLLKI